MNPVFHFVSYGLRLLLQQRWAYEVQHSFSTGLGVIAVPMLALAGRRDSKLVSRPLIEPKLTRMLAVIRHCGVTLSPAAQEFLAMLKNGGSGENVRDAQKHELVQKVPKLE